MLRCLIHVLFCGALPVRIFFPKIGHHKLAVPAHHVAGEFLPPEVKLLPDRFFDRIEDFSVAFKHVVSGVRGNGHYQYSHCLIAMAACQSPSCITQWIMLRTYLARERAWQEHLFAVGQDREGAPVLIVGPSLDLCLFGANTSDLDCRAANLIHRAIRAPTKPLPFLKQLPEKRFIGKNLLPVCRHVQLPNRQSNGRRGVHAVTAASKSES